MSRADGVLIALVAALIAALAWRVWLPPAAAAWVEVRCGDGPAQRYALDTDRRLAVPCRLGVSHLIIAAGRVRFADSPCPNKLCVHAGWLSRTGDSAACLPNGVSIELGGRGGTAIDAVSQ